MTNSTSRDQWFGNICLSFSCVYSPLQFSPSSVFHFMHVSLLFSRFLHICRQPGSRHFSFGESLMVTNLSSLALYVWRLSKQFVSLRFCTFCFGTITQLRRGWCPHAFSWLTGLPMTSLGIITKAPVKLMSFNSFLCCHLTFSPSVDHMSKM